MTAHGQRGLHATLAVESGITAHAVAAALGHASFKVTAQSYAQPGAMDAVRQDRAFAVLEGGLSNKEKVEQKSPDVAESAEKLRKKTLPQIRSLRKLQ